VKDEDHVCNPDTVKTMQLIKRDSKSCPKCGIMIHRTDGCAQMWCTSCHCTFNWRTGEIETGRIHNPHYIQFKRKTNTSREHGDIPCGGIPSFRELREKMATQEILQYAMVVYETDRHNLYLDTRPPDNVNFRIGYMLNEISLEDFKNILQRQEKFVDKVRDISNIY
jgi:ribosomal protein S27AE